MPNTPLILRAATEIDALVIFVDGYPDRSHKLDTHIGDERLENGRAVTDHVVSVPQVLAVTGSVSDMLGGNRTKQAWQLIQYLHRTSTVVRVTTEWGVYPEMVIKRCIGTPVGRGMSFDMELREIERFNIAQVPTVPPLAQIGVAANRAGETRRGRVSLGEPKIFEVTDPAADPAAGF